MTPKSKARENMSARSGKREQRHEKASSSFIFEFALSQFRGPDYLVTWNRVLLGMLVDTFLDEAITTQLSIKEVD